MTNFILTILFGYLGTYRFSKKQYGLGLLYLFTYGLFGIGWLYDICLSYKDYKNTTSNPDMIKKIQEDEIRNLEYELEKEKLVKKLSEMKNEDTICVYCGAKIKSNSDNCSHCGAPQKE